MPTADQIGTKFHAGSTAQQFVYQQMISDLVAWHTQETSCRELISQNLIDEVIYQSVELMEVYRRTC